MVVSKFAYEKALVLLELLLVQKVGYSVSLNNCYDVYFCLHTVNVIFVMSIPFRPFFKAFFVLEYLAEIKHEYSFDVFPVRIFILLSIVDRLVKISFKARFKSFGFLHLRLRLVIFGLCRVKTLN